LEEEMTDISPTPNESIVDPLVELARCSKQHRIIVAGSNGPQLMFQLYRRGYRRVATTATYGLPDGRYDVALVDWQDHSVKALATTLDWLVHFLAPSAVAVIRVGSREGGASRKLASMLERLGFRVEAGTRCEHGLVVSARRRDAAPKALAA
jgi:hypothetical protein